MGRITSLQNSKVKLIHRLRSKRGRQSESRLVIDSLRELRRALEMQYRLEYLLYCADQIDIPSWTGPNAYQVNSSLLTQISYRENPDGIVAVMRSKPQQGLFDLEHFDFGGSFLALVGLQIPGNIGALLRTADGAGMDTVLLVDIALDLYNPNVIRNSAGACFRDNIFQLKSEDVFAFRSERDPECQIIAAHDAGKRTLYEVDLRGMTIIALGNEAQGLPREWIARADHIARIPMTGEISDSLNVSVSGALFMYEMVRQKLAASHSS
ncbi:MAG: RNA methyltransferase [Chloroflexota bacterium]|nr:RNA methyltransferase [Chloroflexota bacterium]